MATLSKAHFGTNHGNHRVRLHGSSLHGFENSLDQERASSMSDEGGVSAAEMDAHDQQLARQQCEVALQQQQRWTTWALVATAVCSTMLAVLLTTRARR